MAISTIKDVNAPVELNTTYNGPNPYITSEMFDMIKFYRIGKIVLVWLNLNVATSPGITWRKLGSVDFPETPIDSLVMTMASQGSSYNLLARVEQNGNISIYSNGSSTGWYRGYGFMILP